MRFFSVIVASSPEIGSENTSKSEPNVATDAPGFGEGELDPAGALPELDGVAPGAAEGVAEGEPAAGVAALAWPPAGVDAEAAGVVVTVVVPPT